METKWCPACKQTKLVSEFGRNRARGDGLSGYCIECHRRRSNESAQRKRLIFLLEMGGRCERCGFSDYRALQIDHVNGGGRLERASLPAASAAFYAKALANRDQYALLCANCNQIKKHEQSEYVGVRIYDRSPPTERKKGVGKGNAPTQREALARNRTSEHQRNASKAGWADPEKRAARIKKLRASATGRKLVDGHWVRPDLD